MSYQITYTLSKEELNPKFIPCYKHLDELRSDINAIRLELKLNALLSSEESIATIIKDINLKVRQYFFLLEDLAKHYIYDSISSEGKVTFYGWQYSEDPEYDIRQLANNVTERICIQKLIVPTKGYYDNDEEFSQKCDEIDCILDYEEIMLETIYSAFKELYFEKSDEYQNDSGEEDEDGN